MPGDSKIYRIRRQNILDSISQTLIRLGAEPIAESTGEFWRAKWDNGTMTVQFATVKSFFGVLINSVYLVCIPEYSPTVDKSIGELYLTWNGTWKHPQPMFKGKRFPYSALTEALNGDRELISAINDGGVKSLRIFLSLNGEQLLWNIDLRPLAGSISGMWFPPVHPFEVSLKEREVVAHYTILRSVSKLLPEAKVS